MPTISRASHIAAQGSFQKFHAGLRIQLLRSVPYVLESENDTDEHTDISIRSLMRNMPYRLLRQREKVDFNSGKDLLVWAATWRHNLHWPALVYVLPRLGPYILERKPFVSVMVRSCAQGIDYIQDMAFRLAVVVIIRHVSSLWEAAPELALSVAAAFTRIVLWARLGWGGITDCEVPASKDAGARCVHSRGISKRSVGSRGLCH